MKNARKNGLGVPLTEEQAGQEQIIACASTTVGKSEKEKYFAMELDDLAVKLDIWKMRYYLESYHSVVVANNRSFKWLDNIDNPAGGIYHKNAFISM